MNIETIELDKLKQYHLNCKIHNKKNINAIKKSLEKFNQYKPLIVSKNNFEIIIGNGTFQALKELNFKTAEVILLDLTQQQQKILNILDNKSSDLSTWNDNLLDKINLFDEQLLNLLDFDKDFLKKFEKIEKIKKDKTIEKIEQQIINENQQLLVNKPNFIICPCCNKKFQIP